MWGNVEGWPARWSMMELSGSVQQNPWKELFLLLSPIPRAIEVQGN